ncbi:MAG: hypothetical protein R3F62_29780 [Planctomycetota bacterium]
MNRSAGCRPGNTARNAQALRVGSAKNAATGGPRPRIDPAVGVHEGEELAPRRLCAEGQLRAARGPGEQHSRACGARDLARAIAAAAVDDEQLGPGKA